MNWKEVIFYSGNRPIRLAQLLLRPPPMYISSEISINFNGKISGVLFSCDDILQMRNKILTINNIHWKLKAFNFVDLKNWYYYIYFIHIHFSILWVMKCVQISPGIVKMQNSFCIFVKNLCPYRMVYVKVCKGSFKLSEFFQE